MQIKKEAFVESVQRQYRVKVDSDDDDENEETEKQTRILRRECYVFDIGHTTLVEIGDHVLEMHSEESTWMR